MDPASLIDGAIKDFSKLSDGYSQFVPTLRDPKIVSFLRAKRKNQMLVPALGAGISFPLRIPGWNTVLDNLCSEILHGLGKRAATAAAADLGLIALARILESEASFKSIFRTQLHHALYKNFTLRYNDRTLRALVRLFNRKDGAPVRSLITYNFDNLIELYTEEMLPQLAVKPVYSSQTFVEATGNIEIFHPHGYMPHKDDMRPESLLVFSERDYHKIYQDHSSWATIVQMSTFARMTCLFIGLSMRDPNLRRLIDHALADRSVQKGKGHQHVAIMRCGDLRKPNERWRCYLIEKDLASLKIETLWIDNFDDIPGILNKI
tara:strand:+ start:747 stop:1706 length:960 start_codon:yes stop_codon:yes gene_type:complete